MLEDGFRCPSERVFTDAGTEVTHPSYPHLDCQKFYVCVDGKVPRLQSCSEDHSFNPVSGVCEDYETVELW